MCFSWSTFTEAQDSLTRLGFRYNEEDNVWRGIVKTPVTGKDNTSIKFILTQQGARVGVQLFGFEEKKQGRADKGVKRTSYKVKITRTVVEQITTC